ncbi:RadC family protein [Sediminispirochaeta smaragdinae]|uniref:DNA repair protein RadC n=1 Tax=Sediminispirochaeta smaragdinae (strain DSM 11293 / JCM 15392 / SEBR 4228) TaxID=573413 RepID=E1R2L7_SEDSS|nr:DNA repair protein RadC [Sediminispirochaeta smaragdinae]ADK82577.1 DNA repair protein RadC [Sediminispirochaeta smaragdinae DSM 11293]
MKVEESRIPIMSLPAEERPRERLSAFGPSTLSDKELLTIILGSGIKGNDVGHLASALLKLLDTSDLHCTVDQIRTIPGIGRAKAALVAAALEFSRRRFVPAKNKITSPADVLPLVRHLADRPQEQFLALSLNGAHEVIKLRIISVGLVNRTLVHPREIFAGCVKDRAAALICAHNHPSGNLQPSAEDHEVTRRLTASGEILGIPLIDHIIFTQEGYYSFLEHDGLGQ